MGGEEVRRFSRGRELRQGDEVDNLREPVDHSQDGVVALGSRETSDEVKGYVDRGWVAGVGDRQGDDGRLCCGHRRCRLPRNPGRLPPGFSRTATLVLGISVPVACLGLPRSIN